MTKTLPLDRTGWSTAVPDWGDRIREGRSLLPDLPLFDDQGERALRIFKRLRMPDEPGLPTYGELCADWVFDLVRVVFGSFDPETKRRMLREFFILVPKKNGKSSIAAAMIVTAAIMNERPRAELLLIAPTMKIADTAFRNAKGIIECDQELSKLFHIRDHLKTIRHRLLEAEIMIKAADTSVVTGGRATYTLIDETHEFIRKAAAADIFSEIRGAMASRPDGFLMQITTQSKGPPSGVFDKELTRARAVRDGELDWPLLPLLYELPPDLAKDWKNPETWPLVNPNYGRSVDPVFLHDELKKAEMDGPAALALTASQHFNVEIGVGLRVESWLAAEYWGAAEDPELTLDEIIERSDVAVMGVDGGGLDDLLGVAVLGRCATTGNWLHWAHAWAHEDVFARRKEVASALRGFAEDGDLTVVSGAEPQADLDGVAALAERLKTAGLLPRAEAIGVDPQGVVAFTQAMAARGIIEDQMPRVGQGYRLSPAIWGLERMLKDGSFRHSGQRLMNWCIGNAKIEQRGSAVAMEKATAGKAKIDPVIAMLNAFMLMARNPMAALPATPWDMDPEFRMSA